MKEEKNKKILYVIVSILAIVILNSLATYFIFMQIEYSKVGWKENYELLNKLQLQQIQQLVEYYKANPQMMDMGNNMGAEETPAIDFNSESSASGTETASGVSK